MIKAKIDPINAVMILTSIDRLYCTKITKSLDVTWNIKEKNNNQHWLLVFS